MAAFGCGGGGGSGSVKFSTVTISATYKSSSSSAGSMKAAAAMPTHIRYTVTGHNMGVITGVVPAAGDFVDIELKVPSGPQRHFVIEALSGSGGVIYRGEAFHDLDGTPIVIDIILEEIIPNQLVGTWGYINLDHDIEGTWESSAGKIIFNADGTGTQTYTENNSDNGGTVQSLFKNFTYSITPNQDGTITLQMTYDGETSPPRRFVLSDNGKMMMLDYTDVLDSNEMTVAIRMDTSKTYTDADLNGDYYGIGYEYNGDLIFNNPGFYNAGSSIQSYDGNGEFSLLRTLNSDGAIFTDSVIAPYSVNADGSFVFGYGDVNGYIGLSGLFVNSHPTVNNHWRFGFSMQREDRTYSTPDLGGTWVLTGFGDGNEGNSFGSAFGKMTCDSIGNCNAFLKNRKDGEIINEAVDFRDIFVEQDGSFGYFPDSISPNYAAAIGNDGNTVLLNMSFGQSTLYDREILIGVRCSNCTNIMGQGGKIQARRAFNFKKRLGVVSHK